MGDDRQRVQRERTRRSRRRSEEQANAQSNGQAYTESQTQLNEIDSIIHDIVAPTNGQDSVVMGGQGAQNVRPLSSEELISQFRQQGGE